MNLFSLFWKPRHQGPVLSPIEVRTDELMSRLEAPLLALALIVAGMAGAPKGVAKLHEDFTELARALVPVLVRLKRLVVG